MIHIIINDEPFQYKYIFKDQVSGSKVLLWGVAAHLKHSAQAPTYDGTIIYNDPVLSLN
jgi:hypothetical protein